jgi:DNA (cytosine-5)-methyltransferase 1
MNHGALFNGIGGFQLAAEWMGWKNVMSCEIDNFCNKVTKFYWPNCIQHGDIRKTNFNIYRGWVDILTGGFPCQPYSLAGQRKGKDDERNLWPEMLRAIREIQPSWVVGENVYGLINWKGGMVLKEIQTDLENEGFEVFPPVIIPACGKDAPHIRYRVWIVAHSNSNGQRNNEFKEDRQQKGGYQIKEDKWERLWIQPERNVATGDAPNSISERRCSGNGGREHAVHVDACSKIIGSTRDFERWPTESPLCFRNDGISTQLSGITFSALRRKGINAMGNAVVPQVVFELFKAIEAFNQLTIKKSNHG